MSKLWQKKGKKLHPLIEKYTAQNDAILDQILMPYDIQGTKAHVKGLEKIGIFKKGELSKILKALTKLDKDFQKGKVKITIKDEDCHTVIENYLTKKYKKLGAKIHTGRSRNDQVLTAIRLYMKDHLSKIRKNTYSLCKNFLEFGQEYKKIPMPGYSHTQQAMLSSIGHWALSFTESLIDDITFLDKVHDHIDKNPLGSAAGFGVNMLIPREFTTRELKFKELQLNSLYCQNSRGKFESIYLESLVQIMLTLGKFANDLIFFTTREIDFFKVKDSLTTGSSIMPQKKNHDALEVLRANVSVVINHQNLIQNIIKNLISGYHRDLQIIKKSLFESTQIVSESIEIIELYLKNITPKTDQITKKISKDIFSADLALEIAQKKNTPFRKAYQIALKLLKNKPINIEENLKSKISLGAAGNLDLHYYKELLGLKQKSEASQKRKINK